MMSGCAIYSKEYYIPVDNQTRNAKPLSKDDVVRVVITHNYLDVLPPPQQPGWTNWGYFISARQATEKYLEKLGYNLVDTGYNPKNNGHPTVIALVDSSPIAGTEEKTEHNMTVPLFTDDMGRTTMSQMQGETITYKTYYYKVTLIRPEGENNSLFQCLSSQDPTGVCIAPVNPSNYKMIFTGYATLTTDNKVSTINTDHLTAAVFYNYPNMMGKKWVYFRNGGYTPTYVTDHNAPKPTDKK